MPDRLQKILAAAGIASRRKAEEIIAAGRVTLNGAVVTEQGTKADADRDIICVDGQPLKRAQLLRLLPSLQAQGLRHHRQRS